jgi:hypothetical protein
VDKSSRNGNRDNMILYMRARNARLDERQPSIDEDITLAYAS